MVLRAPVARLAIALAAGILSSGAVQESSDWVDVQLLTFNDFHGHLEPPAGSNGRIGSTPAGGIEYLATHLAQLEAQNPNTLTVAAGDLIGASPLLSGLFHDEPTIEALNAAGLDVSSVGNHEFDEGWAELYRMQHGGCHPVDGCQDRTPFTGATFQYLAANVVLDPRKVDNAVRARNGMPLTDRRPRPLFPASLVKVVGGVKIGFIGMTLRRTPELVGQKGVEALTFRPEAITANEVIDLLRKQGVHAIVVLIHQGGRPTGPDYNSCDGVSGAIEPIARQISSDVDVIVSGHTHTAYICTFGGKLVTSAAAFGRLITKIDLRIDKRTGDVVSKTARNVVVTREVEKSTAQTAILARYRPFYDAIGHTLIGTIARDITRAPNDAGESALGDLIADAMLEATRDHAAGGAVIAFMNPGGIRTDLTLDSPPTPGMPSEVSYAEAFDVLPFQNRLVTKTYTGAMIREALEQQFDNPDPGRNEMLQVSAGFSYAYDGSRPTGARVDPASITINGQRVEAQKKYRVAMTEFTGDGGDNFVAFTRGTDPLYTVNDLAALQAYFRRHSPAVPGPMNRITRLR